MPDFMKSSLGLRSETNALVTLQFDGIVPLPKCEKMVVITERIKWSAASDYRSRS
jgi:hypothetical protein